MAATSRGTALLPGVTDPALDDYIVVRSSHSHDLNEEYIMDEDGAPSTHLVYFKHDRLELDLIAKATITNIAGIESDFPKGAACTVSGGTNTDLTAYKVEDCVIDQQSNPMSVRVVLVNDGLNA